jgi:hypothetical protein
LKASIARAFSVVSFSTASILRARQPSVFMRVSTILNAPGSRARGPVVFGLLPLLSSPSRPPWRRSVRSAIDGKPKQETEVSLRTAVARELTDEDLAAIAVGASAANQATKADKPIVQDPASGKLKLN